MLSIRRLRTVANVARRATQSARDGNVRFSQVVWDPKNVPKQLSKELKPALYLVATPIGVTPRSAPYSSTFSQFALYIQIGMLAAFRMYITHARHVLTELHCYKKNSSHFQLVLHTSVARLLVAYKLYCNSIAGLMTPWLAAESHAHLHSHITGGVGKLVWATICQTIEASCKTA